MNNIDYVCDSESAIEAVNDCFSLPKDRFTF